MRTYTLNAVLSRAAGGEQFLGSHTTTAQRSSTAISRMLAHLPGYEEIEQALKDGGRLTVTLWTGTDKRVPANKKTKGIR